VRSMVNFPSAMEGLYSIGWLIFRFSRTAGHGLSLHKP